ncbi:hypothetical protein CONLIGDRAFT_675519 [Coniochaeta ligniaria NRRL 30616]|uniref:Uncharacterized protein n=1 Tax=Coniochaeta ligniaria NRRL 30616 TaxID=1408157 RepID=A0A1J7J375_9PEZI|nr:hypothetical protein CONLIGDRAFT_675519 [Coniochaeta ligniaria NRRL 30616]
MCYGEEIAYRCGHSSLPVVRPCPLTTSGHNNPICQIQITYEYNAPTMCVACERILHSRWTLLQEWEHRWYHERGVCRCEIYFPELDHRSRVIGDVGTANDCQSDDEATLGSSPTMCAATPEELDMRTVSPSKTKVNGDDNKQLVAARSQDENQGERPIVVDGRQGHVPQDHTPALYQEKPDSNTMHVTARQSSQYAAEWLEDHREAHTAGRCHCRVDMKPMTKPNIKAPMTADDEKVLTLHRQITGDGLDPEECTSPTKEDIDRWRKETDLPELGTTPAWTVTTRRAPDTTQYPVPLGNNMFLTEHFVVWDARLLASRVESMQIASPMNERGGGSSARVSNGIMPVAQETVYVYQPDAGGPSKDTRKKGKGRFAGRKPRRDTASSPRHAGSVGPGLHVDSSPGWQHQQGQTSADFAVAQTQQSMQNAQYSFQQHQQKCLEYGMAVSQADQYAHNALYQPTPHRMTAAAPVLQSQQHMQHTQHVLRPSGSVSPTQQENIPHNETPPKQDMQNTPPGLTLVEGAGSVIGWYELTPPNTHAGKGMNGKLATSASEADRTPTKPSQTADKPANRPAAVVNGTRNPPNKSGPSNGSSSGTTSTAATPSKKHRKTAARKMKNKQHKAEKEKDGKEIAVDDKGKEQRCEIPLCGLPIGAGPESSKSQRPAFAKCSLFYQVKKHRRGSSCPELQDTKPLSSTD